SPLAVPAVPENVGVATLIEDPFDGAASETTGNAVSTVNVLAELRPRLPSESDCWAWAVYVPSLSVGEAGTDQAPPLAVVLTVSTGEPDAEEPLYTLTVTVGRSPPAVPADPEKVGVPVLIDVPLRGALRGTAGAGAGGDV